MNSRYLFLSLTLITSLIFSGCGPTGTVVVVYGGYKVATDERTLGTMVDDSVICTTIKIKMISNEIVKARHIDVDVLNGIVYLTGIVKTSEQKKKATTIAKDVKGVKQVKNQLMIGQINIAQIVNDTLLTTKIRLYLLKDMDILSTNIDVDTHNNIIILTGILSLKKEKEKTLSIVQEVVGDRQIIDNLIVGS